MKNILLSWVFLFICFLVKSQETFPTNGPTDPRNNFHAFINATIISAPGQKIENATLVIKKGEIVSISKAKAPKGAIIHDLEGKSIYPSFIELNSNYGLGNADLGTTYKDRRDGQVFLSTKKGAYGWNEAIHPETNAAQFFHTDNQSAEKYISNGFGTLLTHVQDGIARGTGSLVLLNDTDQSALLTDKASHHFSFDKGSSTQNYPSSLMGSIALLRQTSFDALWYATNENKETNLSLKAWNNNKNLPAFFTANDPLNTLRVAKLGKEIGYNFNIIGNGEEYQRLKEIKATNATMIIPINFPEAYDVEDPDDAKIVTLAQMKHWKMAPYNLSFLEQENVPFAITTSGLKDTKSFISNLQQAVNNGLSERKALDALTLTPAKLLGVSNKIGSIQPGKIANFIITSDNIFTHPDAKILENWVNGEQHLIERYSVNKDIYGNYTLKVDNKNYTLKIREQGLKPNFEVFENDTTALKTNGSYVNDVISISFDKTDGKVRLNGWKSGDQFKGAGFNESGSPIDWDAKWVSEYKNEIPDNQDEPSNISNKVNTVTLKDVNYPFMGYGWKEQPQIESILFKNATVWTSEEEGILLNTDVLIQEGKIKQIGKNLNARTAQVVDASGLHLTAGIIDEHSHICISRGVNEGTQASSAEVRIGDVVNSEHIALYRVLGGGVTTSQLLHGSANPIGGQSAIIKSRWGLSPEEMKFENADEFIKFALGENVKQSNRDRQFDTRYPQTRMGVEQVYDNYFTRAKEYEKKKKSNPNTRRDLELEALLEIINNQRFITCHSYVQSEINMLMQVAERHGFRVNTFTHILEGYKVADKMQKHGVGASTFSDWWAYKYEVNDAIPYNASILTREGVVTAINSDDAEMARRLNQEAAKMVKYGGMTQEEAWEMVTINPAKLLHIEDRVGSIKAGKDADVVLWSNNPLSIYARVLQTYVDGRKYFDADEEQAKRAEIIKERESLIQEMLKAKKSGAPTQKPKPNKGLEYNCVHLGQEGLINSKHNH